MRTSTSYWLIISLCVCDIGMVVVSIAHIIPSTAFHDAFSEFDSPRNFLMIFLYDIFWYTEVVHFGMMAVNSPTSAVTHASQLFSMDAKYVGISDGLCFWMEDDFRYTSILHPTYYAVCFSTKRTAYLIIFCYLLGFLVSVPTLLPCCHTVWDPSHYITVYTTPDTW
ncbi:hypothetical protein ANCCAN_03693 [Ancylostoma caninum]|uniref:Uncharacterized protein n=1 Tax=Ancylostoma caninum TaxID=29170 RepID=A0A368H2U8_ANCCA|nr:hypothetical protein ANCCAN_03693 [Ancylostoma caninum]